MRALLIAISIGCSLPACGDPGAAPGWRVEGGFIRDPEGRAVVMRGINLSGEHKSKPYLGWHTREDVLRVRDAWGMNALRFVLTWAALEPERDRFDESYLARLEERLDWAAEARLLVVLDMHQDVYGEGFGGDGAPRWSCDEALYASHKPVSPWYANYASPSVMTCFDRLYQQGDARDRFVKAWRHLASRLAQHPAVIGFEVLNEPHWGSASVWSFERERLQPFYAEVVAAVREAAPGWLAFLEPASSRNLAIPTSLEPFASAGIERAVYAPHSYDATAEGGGGFDLARRAALTENLAALAREAQTLGAALWIGEYGGVSDDPGIAAYMDASYDGAAAVAASTIYWDYTKGGYGVLDKQGQEQKALLEILVRPYPERVAGLAAVILAAGKGTRMKSDKAKVLHGLLGRPMVLYVVETARRLAGNDVVLVIGTQAEAVREAVSAEAEGLRYALQAEQRGTGHAVACALPELPEGGDPVLILCGDVPLIRASTLLRLVSEHRLNRRDITVMAVEMENPRGYGRILTEGACAVTGIVEEADATDAQKRIRIVNTGVYCVRKEVLSGLLGQLRDDNAQGELYLTDIVGIACREGRSVGVVVGADPAEFQGVNSPQDLAAAEAALRSRRAAPGAA